MIQMETGNSTFVTQNINVIEGSVDNAITNPVDLFVDEFDDQSWDHPGKKPTPAERLLLEKKLTVDELKAQLPDENHSQGSRLLKTYTGTTANAQTIQITHVNTDVNTAVN